MKFDQLIRRAFTALLGGAAAAWPRAARAQQSAKKMLRVGTVSALQQSSPLWVAFVRRMAELGYQEGKTFKHRSIPSGPKPCSCPGTRWSAASSTAALDPNP